MFFESLYIVGRPMLLKINARQVLSRDIILNFLKKLTFIYILILGVPHSAFAQTGFWNLALTPSAGTAGADGTLYVSFTGSVSAIDSYDAVALVRVYDGATMMREVIYNVGYDRFDNPINTTRAIGVGMPLSAGTHQLYAEASTVNGGFTSQVLTISIQPSPPVPSPPPMPTGLTATGGISTISLNWNAVSGATSYSILKTTSNSSSIISGIIAGSYADNNVTQTTGYYYNVMACNAIGCSSWSPTSYAVPIPVSSPPTAPTSLAASQNGQSIVLSWTPSNATQYQLFRINNGQAFSIAQVYATTFTDTTIATDTDYFYQVQACNAAGCSGVVSSSNIIIPHIPIQPAQLLVAVRMGGINIKWTNSDNATSFKLSRNGIQILSSAVTSYIDTTTINGESYIYGLNACNNTGCSAQTSSSLVVAGDIRIKDEYEYNALGRLTKFRSDDTLKTEYQYDAAGNRKNVKE